MMPKPLKYLLQYLLYFICIYSTEAFSAHQDNINRVPYFSAEYIADIQGFEVSAKREYKPLSDSISELSFNADSLLASLSETSQFSWQDDKIKPIRFTHTRTIFGQSKRKTLSFNWDENTITSTRDGQTYLIDNPQEALDHLSFQLQLQQDIGNQLNKKIYRIADKKKIKEYVFEIIGEEVLNTSLGKMNTIKVQVLRDNKDRATYIWLAKDWNNLLIKMEQYEDNKREFAIELTKAVIGGKKVTGL